MGRDITKLHPELQTIVNNLTDKCKAIGLPILITETFRTKAEQDALYEQGRTKPGNIVTNVKYPNSAHCWGIAFDFCKNIKGQEYNDSDGFFKKVGEIGESLGLEWGGRWTSFVDKPHLQMKKYMPGNSTGTLVNTYGTPDSFIRRWSNDPIPEGKGEKIDMEELRKLQEQYEFDKKSFLEGIRKNESSIRVLTERIDDLVLLVEALMKQIEKSTNDTIINKLEDVPEWYRPSVQKFTKMDRADGSGRKVLEGDENGDLQLTDDLMRILTIIDRIGCIYGK